MIDASREYESVRGRGRWKVRENASEVPEDVAECRERKCRKCDGYVSLLRIVEGIHGATRERERAVSAGRRG